MRSNSIAPLPIVTLDDLSAIEFTPSRFFAAESIIPDGAVEEIPVGVLEEGMSVYVPEADGFGYVSHIFNARYEREVQIVVYGLAIYNAVISYDNHLIVRA